MAAPRSISVLMPVRNGARYLDRVLEALARQRVGVPWDFLAVDSGSTDGTLEIFARHAAGWPVPLRVHSIEGAEFNHGCTRNLAAALSEGELLVFLTDDAIPMADDWLARFAANFEDERVAAAYCRNVTRPEADVLVRLFNELDPAYGTERVEAELPPAPTYAAMGPDERRLLFNFCDTASAMRRELWERHPYPRCVFGEDVLIARAFMEGGYWVVFDDRATVEHSHDYDASMTRKRARLDARFNAEWLGRICIPTRKTALRLAAEQLERDRVALAALEDGAQGELEERVRTAGELRRAHFEGLYEGGRARERFRRTALTPGDRPARTCFVLDGAGAELDWEAWLERVVPPLRELGREVQVVGIEELEDWPEHDGDEGLEPVAAHFLAPGAAALEWLYAGSLGNAPFLVSLDPTAMNADDVAVEVLEACRWARLVLTPTRALRERLTSEAGFDPLQVVLSPCSGLLEEGAGRSCSPRENALELAFRHRLLEAEDTGVRPPGVLSEPPPSLCRRGGSARQSGSGAMVLDPGGWIESSLELPDGRHELDLHLAFAASGGPMDGRVLIDGKAVARVGPLTGEGRRETPLLTLPLGGGSHTIRIEGGPLRVARLVVHRGPVRKPRPTERLAGVERALRALVGRPRRLEPPTTA